MTTDQTNGAAGVTAVEAPLPASAIPNIVEALTAAKMAMTEGGVPPERVLEMLKGLTRKKKGRKVPELPEFTFPTSGYTIRVRRIGPWTLDEIRQGLRKLRSEPPVPINDVEDGEHPDGRPRFRKEANPADPEYIRIHKEYEEWLSEAAGHRLLDVIISSCIVIDPEDIDLGEISAQRRALVAAGPQDDKLGEDHKKKIAAMPDEEIFIRCICLQSGADVADLQGYVTSRSMPTMEAVTEQVDTFQPDVQGEADLRHPDAEIGVHV